MVWELLAIWTIVIVTVTWFVRDEKKRIADADMALAARYYAHSKKYRHLTAQPEMIPVPARRPGGLTERQRAFIEAYRG